MFAPEKLYLVSGSLLAFSISINLYLSSYFLGLFILSILIISFRRNKKSLDNNVSGISRNRKNFFILFLILFGISGSSIFIHDTTINYFEVLARRSPILLIGIAGLLTQTDSQNKQLLYKSYIIGSLLLVIFVFVKILFNYFTEPFFKFDLIQNLFQSINTSIINIQHRTYFGINLITAIIFCFILAKREKKNIHLYYIAIFIFICFILFSGSRAVFISLVFIAIYFLIKNLIYIKNFKISVIIIVIGVLFGFIYTNFHPRFQEKPNSSILDFDNLAKQFNDTIRLDIWSTSIDVLKDKPITGFGTSNFQNRLNSEYIKLNKEYLTNLNPHNQFLEFGLESGIIQVIVLLIIFITAFRYKGPNKSFIWSISILYLINLIFESLLSRSWGITHFVFIYYLLYSDINSDEKLINNKNRIGLVIQILLSFIFILFTITFLASHIKVSFNPNNPSTYAKVNCEIIDNLPGTPPKQIAEKTKGYLLDKRSFNYANKISTTKIGSSTPFECDSISFSAYCYVSEDFNGNNIFVGTFTKGFFVVDNYQLKDRETWQKLSINIPCPIIETNYYLYFSIGDNISADSFNGFVIFAKPILEKK